MQEVANLEADSRAMDRRIIVDGSVIAHIGPHCKRYRFRLNNLQKLSYYWECDFVIFFFFQIGRMGRTVCVKKLFFEEYKRSV